jgi:hypothetical protein
MDFRVLESQVEVFNRELIPQLQISYYHSKNKFKLIFLISRLHNLQFSYLFGHYILLTNSRQL